MEANAKADSADIWSRKARLATDFEALLVDAMLIWLSSRQEEVFGAMVNREIKKSKDGYFYDPVNHKNGSRADASGSDGNFDADWFRISPNVSAHISLYLEKHRPVLVTARRSSERPTISREPNTPPAPYRLFPGYATEDTFRQSAVSRASGVGVRLLRRILGNAFTTDISAPGASVDGAPTGNISTASVCKHMLHNWHTHISSYSPDTRMNIYEYMEEKIGKYL